MRETAFPQSIRITHFPIHTARPRQVRADVIDTSRIATNADPHVTAASLHFTAEVTVLLGALRSRPGMSRLRDKLINDSIKLLLDKHVVVSVKDDIHARVDQHLMNRFTPTRPTLIEFIFAGISLAAPFPKRSRFNAASIVTVRAADQMMQKHKSKLGLAAG